MDNKKSIPWLLVGITFSVALVAGAVGALATNEWWILPLVLGLHLVGFLLTVGLTGRALDETDKPSATEEARLEEQEGVRHVREQDAEEPKPII